MSKHQNTTNPTDQGLRNDPGICCTKPGHFRHGRVAQHFPERLHAIVAIPPARPAGYAHPIVPIVRKVSGEGVSRLSHGLNIRL
jgi:hypothetical protein